MAFIDYIPFEDASPELQALYIKYGGAKKVPPNVYRISGVNPSVMESHANLSRTIMYGKSPLTRHQREMIALVVSAINKCHY